MYIMQEKIKQINQLVEQVDKAHSLLRDVLQHYEELQRPSAARRERNPKMRNRCRCLEYCDDSSENVDELFSFRKNAPEQESRRHRRDDRKRDRSHSRGRSRGHSRGRSHGRSRSRSHTNAAHKQMTLAVQV